MTDFRNAAASARGRLACVGLVLAIVLVFGGCSRMPDTGTTTMKPASLGDLERQVAARKPDLELFRQRGPYEVVVQSDLALRLGGGETVHADLYVANQSEKAPLVVLLHGYENTKEHHAYQAYHLASWGMHSLALQLPNKGPWAGNGRKLVAVVRALRNGQFGLDPRIDPDRIVLVGHSFGATSASVALANGVSVRGGVLLDPAGIGRDLRDHLKKVRSPVLVLGADPAVTATRRRGDFFGYIPAGVAEVSIKGADHQDAEFPMEPVARAPGEEPRVHEGQITFVSALTAAAFSLGYNGRLDYAWRVLDEGVRSGRLFDPRKK